MGKLINTKIIYMVTDFLHIYNIGKIYIYNIGKNIYLILGKILDILFEVKFISNIGKNISQLPQKLRQMIIKYIMMTIIK